MGEYDRALEEFRTALKDKNYPSPEKIHLNIGHLYLDQSNAPAAIRSFREAVSLNPDYLLGYIGLGLAYRHAGQDDRAAGEFRKVVSLKPQSREADRARLLLKGEVRLDAQ